MFNRCIIYGKLEQQELQPVTNQIDGKCSPGCSVTVCVVWESMWRAGDLGGEWTERS